MGWRARARRALRPPFAAPLAERQRGRCVARSFQRRHALAVATRTSRIPGTGGSTMAVGREFREFVVRGNVIDMAVGIIIGAAFGAIVASLVDDIIMPPVGLLLGGVSFEDLFLVLRSAEPDAHYQTL